MGYLALADATMMVHFGFLAYVTGGGFLAWRWPRMIWPHLALTGWGLLTVVLHLDCPLTFVEDWARRRGGEVGLPSFVDHYLTGVVYPERYTGMLQLLVAGVVMTSWVGAWVRRRRPRRDHAPQAAAAQAARRA